MAPVCVGDRVSGRQLVVADGREDMSGEARGVFYVVKVEAKAEAQAQARDQATHP